ncbi:glycoside hydrolase family 95-like protein [Pedobacter sp. ASV1-7]|uniref:glycosyl hydrolase family 95 catalytic domain-containing protein n=1 Tax=Pedobacter sp. ASV1-7 TaxID=3145237 RepID=UPI0032E91B6C
MIKKVLALGICSLLANLPVQGQSPGTASKNKGSTLINVDYKSLVSRADLDYVEPVKTSEAGMPVGNGTMGTLLWTTPAQLKMQLNRVDIFGSNAATNNFFQRNTEYGGGAAFVDLDFGVPVFNKPDFKQHLYCYDGLISTVGKDIKANTLIWNKEDVMAVNISDKRQLNAGFTASLRMFRNPVTNRGNHTAVSKISIHGEYIVLTQVFKEDDYYCGSAVVMGIQGSSVTAEVANETTVRLLTGSGQKDFTVYTASAASFDPSIDLTATAIKKLEAAKSLGFEGLHKSNQQWWADFWSKSFIRMKSSDGEANFVEQNYTYYLYVMAASSRGDYPTKFNGMLWTTGGDPRKWGSAYWGANQSCLYNALFPTNHLELLDPMFNLYTKAFSTFEKSAAQQWGSKGIYIPETVSFDGVEELPDDIAAEMRELYLKQKPWRERTQKFIDYAETKQPFFSRWNWRKDTTWVAGRWPVANRGEGAYSPVNHIFSRGAKLAYQYWQQYEYTQDINWLRDRAYPMLKGMAEFYRNFPNVKKEADGKYHIRHVNDNESIWGGHNTVEEISSMMGIFPTLIKASEILGLDKEMRPVWKEFIANLSPLSTSKSYPDLVGQKEYWVGSLPPWIKGNGQRKPDGNTMPVWFFDLCNLESDPAMLKIAQNTYNGYFPNGINKTVYPYVLSKIPAAGAMLGRKEAIKYLVPNQIKRDPAHEVLSNRMDVSEGYYTTNIQRLGRAADAIQLGLNQTAPPSPGADLIMRVFPAWPDDWDAKYTMLARGNFLVTSSIKQGQIEFVELLSQSGSTCRIRNPWPGKMVVIYRNGKRETEKRNDLMVLNTKKDDRLVLVPEGKTPEQFKQNVN